MLKRSIPAAGLVVLLRTGHIANLEEPDVFNRAADSFLAAPRSPVPLRRHHRHELTIS
jgi:pimeloyl-ACP methyl ester carboxylesterase